MSAGIGDVAFEPTWEVLDELNGDEYFLDAKCVGVHSQRTVIDIKWFDDGREMNASRYVSRISLSTYIWISVYSFHQFNSQYAPEY